MTVAQLRPPRRHAEPYSWTVALSRPARADRTLHFEEMNASEQMFFFDAPLAHVVLYEDHLRQVRADKAARDLLRARRPFSFTAPMAGTAILSAVPLGDRIEA